MNYYNEIDPFCCEWLKNLIDKGLIGSGYVDSRSIEDVKPEDLNGFKQCHFFAGIGGWSYALRLAGVSDDLPVWTGSCPCQPFSVANVVNGGSKGTADERHLLPKFIELIGGGKPSIVFGEQVANAIKWGWLDEAFGNLEAKNYTCGAAIIPALSIGAKHERKRLYWVADSRRKGWKGYQPFECLPSESRETQSLSCDSLARARGILDSGNSHLLFDDGVSVQVERCATKGYGNAIVPQVAAEFIRATL
jgi:DNA (cytosine-5)-methyltransferase 1